MESDLPMEPAVEILSSTIISCTSFGRTSEVLKPGGSDERQLGPARSGGVPGSG